MPFKKFMRRAAEAAGRTAAMADQKNKEEGPRTPPAPGAAPSAPPAEAPRSGGGLKRFRTMFKNAAQQIKPVAQAGERMGGGLRRAFRKAKLMGDTQPAVGLKKGGAVAKKGSAMKSMMSDKKGRAMKKTGADAMGRAMAKKPAAKKMMGGGMMKGYKSGGMAKKKSGRSC